MSHGPLHVIAEVTAKPDAAESLWTHISRLVAPCRNEHGNLAYNVLRDVDDPAHFLFTEVWQTRADFDAHVASKHLAAYDQATRHLIDIPVRITVCHMMSSSSAPDQTLDRPHA